jgi:CubicO group peptidase (beta-lactamase class C family)
MVYPPGKYFQYYGGSNFLLADVIKETTGMDLEAFARKHLFGPLGIEDFRWLRLHKEVVDGAGGLLLRPRDMLKIGLTFLNGGIWHGQRIIPESWVQKSAAPFGENISLNRWDDHWGLKGYGYSWWTHHFVRSSHKTDMYYAAGWGGQYIMVIPALNTVVVFTGGNYTTYRPPFELLKKYILPALR